jgi:hypothetical protein
MCSPGSADSLDGALSGSIAKTILCKRGRSLSKASMRITISFLATTPSIAGRQKVSNKRHGISGAPWESHLSATLAADGVRYSRHIEVDETVRALRKESFEPEVENHAGRTTALDSRFEPQFRWLWLRATNAWQASRSTILSQAIPRCADIRFLLSNVHRKPN